MSNVPISAPTDSAMNDGPTPNEAVSNNLNLGKSILGLCLILIRLC